MGPEPMMSIFRTSVRFGIRTPPRCLFSLVHGVHGTRFGHIAYWRSVCSVVARKERRPSVRPLHDGELARSELALLGVVHHLPELVEEMVRVPRAGAGLGVVLHREDGQGFVPDGLDDAVVGALLPDH